MSLYDQLRHFADSYGLVAIMAVFLALILWTFRPGAKSSNDAVARSILDDEAIEGRKDGQ
jgi:cytochrome c oxidase cbb3-type subunit 4